MKNFNLNLLFQTLKFKKQYLDKLKNKVEYLNSNKKNNFKLIKNLHSKKALAVKYIINITFSKTNTLLHITDFSGNLKFYCSAGKLHYSGKNKTARRIVVRDICYMLISQFDYLANEPVALHLKNVDSTESLILQLLEDYFFIKVIRIFVSYPYNGCRKRKKKRKKIRTNKNSTSIFIDEEKL